MSSDQPYTPNLNQARAYYATTRNDEEDVPIREAFEEWSRFLARVRRDAAREALDGLAEQFDSWAEGDAGDVARTYRDTHYPEGETP